MARAFIISALPRARPEEPQLQTSLETARRSAIQRPDRLTPQSLARLDTAQVQQVPFRPWKTCQGNAEKGKLPS